MIKLSEKHNLFQFIKFGAVGISNTLLSIAVYYFFLYLGWHYQLSNAISWIVGVLNSFYWNSRYVFSFNGTWYKALIKSYFIYGVSFLVVMALLYLLIEVWFISKFIAQPLTLLVSVPLNFFLHKFWAYK